MKKCYSFLICVLTTNISFCQLTKDIDSLTKTLREYYSIELSANENVDTSIIINMNSLSNCYFMSGKYDSAYYYSSEAEKRAVASNYKRGLACAYLYSSFCFEELGNAPKALEYFEKSYAVTVDMKDNLRMAQTMANMASFYNDQGNTDKALRLYTIVLPIFEAANHEISLMGVYGNIGNLYAKLGDDQLALSYYLKVLPLTEKLNDKVSLGILLGNIGGLYANTENFDSAIYYFDRSLSVKREVGNSKSVSYTLYGIGSIYFNQQQYSKAVEYFMAAYEIVLEIRNAKMTRVIEYNLFRCYYFLDEYDLAEKFGLMVIERNKKNLILNFPIFSEAEKELYFSTISVDFEKFNSFALLRKETNPQITEIVYNTILAHKGILLKSSTAMRNAIYSSGDSQLIKDYEKWIDLKSHIVKQISSGVNTTSLEDEANEMEKDLIKKSNAFSDFDKGQMITWNDVQSSLKPNEAAIEFISFKHDRGDDWVPTYCAMIVTSDCEFPEMIELFEEEELKKILGIYSGNNINDINAAYGRSNERKTALYDLIWKPMEKSLEGIRKVYISPSGLLHKVSFAALSKDQNIYLCDDYTIQMVASTAKVVLPEVFRFDEKSNATIFGGINYNTDSTWKEIWNYLEGTKLETENILAILSRRKIPVTYFSTTGATESEFKKMAVSSNILHIATHGFFFPDPKDIDESKDNDSIEIGEIKFRGMGLGYHDFVLNDNPLMRSGLVFAGANDVWSRQNVDGEDGILTAQEVAHLDMRNTQLVVLSACETGLGDIKGDEGVYGLQRAFKMAGVKFIIMSLWKVPDKETSEFMILFYKNLIKLEDIPKAFQKTQNVMREKYDPYYWGAFVLIE